jgi:MFS family permease
LNTNPPKRTAVASFVVALFTAGMIFIPELAGIDGFEGGFAISFVSFFIALVAAVVGVMYLGFANKVDKILRGEGVLAHWTYTSDYWLDYTEKEYKEEKSEKKGLFLIVTGFALFFGIMFWVLDPEAGFIVFLFMLALIGIVAFAWQFSAWHNYRQNIRGVKEAYITRNAVYINRKLYTWDTVFTSFDEVSQKGNQGLSLLVFRFTSATRTGPQTYTIRVPIPPGQEEAAKKIMEEIKIQN